MRLTKYMKEAFVRSVMNDVPMIDYQELLQTLATGDAVAQLPPPVRAIWDRPELRGYIKLECRRIGDRYLYVPLPDEVNFSAETESAAKDLITERDAQDIQRAELHQSLSATAFSVTTRKALAEMLPEFEKYLPEDEGAALRSLPVIANVVASFVKAGWPKAGDDDV